MSEIITESGMLKNIYSTQLIKLKEKFIANYLINFPTKLNV